MSKPSSRDATLLAYIASIKARPSLYRLYLASVADPTNHRASAEFHRAIDADLVLRSLRNLWLDAVRAEEFRMVA